MSNVGKFVLMLQQGFGGGAGFAHEDGHFETADDVKNYALEALKVCPTRRWYVGVIQLFNRGPATEIIRVSDVTTLE